MKLPNHVNQINILVMNAVKKIAECVLLLSAAYSFFFSVKPDHTVTACFFLLVLLINRD